MEHDADLSKLEKDVEKLLSRLDTIQGNNLKLQNDIERLKSEKQALQGELSLLQEESGRLKKEKNTIHQRVVSLIGSIEEWEKSSEGRLGEERTHEAVKKTDVPGQVALGFTAGT